MRPPAANAELARDNEISSNNLSHTRSTADDFSDAIVSGDCFARVVMLRLDGVQVCENKDVERVDGRGKKFQKDIFWAQWCIFDDVEIERGWS